MGSYHLHPGSPHLKDRLEDVDLSLVGVDLLHDLHQPDEDAGPAHAAVAVDSADTIAPLQDGPQLIAELYDGFG